MIPKGHEVISPSATDSANYIAQSQLGSAKQYDNGTDVSEHTGILSTAGVTGESSKLFSKNLTSSGAFFNLVKGLLGTGLLGLPLAFKNAGLWAGLLMLFFITVACTYCMRLLIYSAEYFTPMSDRPSLDYANVVQIAVTSGPPWLKHHGRKFKLLANGLIFIYSFGTCCVYFVFMAENISQVYNQLSGIHYTLFNISVTGWISILLVPILLLSCIRELRTIAPLSLGGNVIYFAAVAITIQYLFYEHLPVATLPAVAPIGSWPLYFGTVIFAFEGITMVLPIRNRCVDDRAFIEHLGILNASCGLVICVYAAVGFFGYLKAGGHVRESITLNLPSDVWIYQVCKLLFALAMMVSFVLQFYVPMQRVEKYIIRKVYRGQETRQVAIIYVIRISVVLTTYVIAVAVPHLDLIMSLVGSFAGAALALIFPPITYLLMLYSKNQTAKGGDGASKSIGAWTWFVHLCLCAFGFVGFLLGTGTALTKIVHTF